MAPRTPLAALCAVVGLLIFTAVQATGPDESAIESPRVTAYATHDTVHVLWDSRGRDAVYNVYLYRDYEYWNYSGFAFGPSRESAVGPGDPYEVTFMRLDPDTAYVIEVYEGDWRSRNPGVVYVRTEPVPDDWWAMNIAHDVKIVAFGNRLLVFWRCLPEPLVDELEVQVKEYGAPKDTVRSRSVDCATSGMLSEPVPAGTVYDIRIQPVGMDPYQRKLIGRIPSAVREDERLEGDGPFWRSSVKYSDEVRGWAFRVTVQGDDPSALFEVEWIRDGYRMTRIGRGPEFTYHSDSPGPFPFRVRQITHQRASSRWSSSRLVGAEPRPPVSFGISYQPRGKELHVTWWDGWHRPDINGYRAYLFGQGAPPQIVDTGQSRRAVFEIAPGLTRYMLLLGAYRHDLGLGELARAEVDLGREPGLLLRVDKYQASCLLQSGSPMRGFWTIKHGVPPYRVTVGAQEPVTLELPHGAFEVGCTAEEGRWSDGGDRFSEVSVEIEDGLGRRMEGRLEYQIRGHGEPGTAPVEAINKPGPVALQVSNVLVGSTGLGVVVQERSIDAQHSRSSFVFRWRIPGDQGWNYERDSVEVGLTRVATILLRGLKPNTPYEFQVAVDITGIRPEEIPDGAWSRLHEERTWPERIQPRVARVGTTVTVTWTQGPNEWGYSVVLRGAGESWWKAHVPSGAEMESVVFRGIPMDAAIEVEVITPPVGAPSWDGYRG